jgi:SAM-dependent methyltransferase
MVESNQPDYSVDWFSNNIPIWDQVFDLAKLKGKENIKFLEIGCFEGRATNYLLENILTGEGSEIHVVDTFEGSREEAGMKWDDNYDFDALYNKFKRNVSKHEDKVKIHRGMSGDILKSDFEKDTFDFIYIDGSHTAYDVLQDAILAHSLLKVGGIIIFDDFGWKDPNNLHPTNSPELGVTCFYNAYELFYNTIFQGYQIGFIKKA